MDQSPYLVQALQQMQQSSVPTQGAGPAMSPQQMAQVIQDKKAWEAANPGQSYIAHGFKQLGQNIQNAPGALMAAPGNVMNGLGNLAKSLPGMGQAPVTPPY